jgi:hypothetical protein
MSGEVPNPCRFVWLEHVTALVLLLVLASLGWMVLAAFCPSVAELVAAEVPIVIMIGLLAAALGLVSVVALLHTRS